jgi:hypothetical protein
MQPVLTVALMHWYNTACIAQWNGSRASLEATGHHHQARTHVVLPIARQTKLSGFSEFFLWRPAEKGA